MDIAIIGMNGRVPGASTVKDFWRNLVAGIESIATFTRSEMAAAGVPEAVLDHQNYIPRGGVLDEVEAFDATFFGYTPREAALIDPQQRLFLECAWGALEDAGYVPAQTQDRIGVFGSVGINTYLVNQVYGSGAINPDELFLTFISNDKDFVSTRVSYKLNLQGPSINVQTACSSSLVAVHMACQHLWLVECDLALAGGCSIRIPQRTGYLYQQDGIESSDGHCHAFDANAKGTVFSNGVGIVVLKRLEDALADRDHIYAVIKGSAVNNDGALKVGYTAPSYEGQAQVIAEALAAAGISPDTLSFVEAHGTGTILGDTVEVQALQRVFAQHTQRRKKCGLGSVKPNIGHLDTAAGVIGLMKAALALSHKLLPPSIKVTRLNPHLEAEDSPFFVNSSPLPLSAPTPLRAGVSSFGIGGTNVHVVLEEAPVPAPTQPAFPAPGYRSSQLLLLSSKSEEALQQVIANLSGALSASPDLNLADVAWTLQVGREAFSHRAIVVADLVAIAAARLADASTIETAVVDSVNASDRPIYFLFPGQGTQYINMGRGLYETEPSFAVILDQAAQQLQSHLGCDFRERLYPQSSQPAHQEWLQQTQHAQPILFALEYALARLLQSWGIEPDLMLGHSLGEYVAACLSGVFSFEQGLHLVATRGRLMQALPPGVMAAVKADPTTIQVYLVSGVSLAAVNGASDCVISGEVDAIQNCVKALEAAGYDHRVLHTSHAFHSAMMEPLLATWAMALKQIQLQPPRLPILSNLTGTFLSPEQAIDPEYWCQHLRHTVQFARGLETVLADPKGICIEVGPGTTLTSLAKRHPRYQKEQVLLTSVRHPRDNQEDTAVLMQLLGRLWLAGQSVEWSRLYPHQRPQRISLPTYPFARDHHWITPPSLTGQPQANNFSHPPAPRLPSPDISRLEASGSEASAQVWLPSWKRRPPLSPTVPPTLTGACLIFIEPSQLATDLQAGIAARGGQPIAIYPGQEFQQWSTDQFVINPQNPADYDTLLQRLQSSGMELTGMIYGWGLETAAPPEGWPTSECERFDALLHLLRAIAHLHPTPLVMTVLIDHLFDITGDEPLNPGKALLLGPVRSMVQELPHLRGVCIDPGNLDDLPHPAQQILMDMFTPDTPPVLGYRGRHMWIPTLEEISLPDSTPDSRAIAPQLGGVYLITGGLGNIGLAAAQVLVELAGDKPVHLYLTSRTADAIAARWQHFQQTGDHSVPSQLQPLQALTQAGGILHLRQVDVASLETMSQLVSEIMTAHQRLDGVIHAAGIVDPTVFVPLVDLTPDQCELHFQPKVTGLNVLTQVLAPVDVGFCFAISSISSWLGGIGYAAYAAANAYMDAVCRAYARTGKPQWLSIDWDAWEFSEQSFQPSPLLNSLKLSGLHLESGKTILRSLVLAQITNQTKMTGGEIIVSQGALQQRWLDWQSAAQTSICPTNTRSALDAATPQFLQDQSANGESSVATKLTHLWLRVLGVKQVNPSDNFFAQGGTSLLSLQLLSQLRQEFPIDLSLQDFFSQPTFGDVLHQILQADVSSRSAHGQADVIPSVPRQQPLPLSFAQQQLWLLEQMESTQNAYQITEVLHLKGSLNVEVLERSMQAIAMRHEILRTRFVTEGDEPVQVIDSVVHQPIIRVESFVPPEGLDLKDALLPIIDAEFSQPFQLEQGLLWSIRLLVLAPTEFVLLIRLHHIIADDWSIGIFMEELSTFYDSFLEGREPALPELPIQYADYSTWQRQTASKAAWQADLEFWTQQLAELPLTLPAPTDYVRQSARTSRGEYYTNPISAEQVRQLQQLSERLSSSQFMILLSVFKGLLHGLSGKTDIVVGTPLVGRDHLQLTSLIGYFINPAVLRTDLAGDISFTTLVERVQRSTLNAYAHQNLPFERLVSELQVERDPTRHPLFQVWFTLLTYTSERSIHPLLTMEPLYLGLRTVPFDLALILEPHREGLVSHWEYSPDLFERSTIIRLGEGFQFLLTQVLEEPDCTLSHLCHRLQEFDQQIRLRQSQALAEQRQTSFNQIRRRAVSSKQSDE